MLSTLLLVTGGSMILPVLCSLIYGEDDLISLGLSCAIIVSIGLMLRRFFRRIDELSFKDGLFVATIGWVIISALSALPFIIHGSIPSFSDAFFEMMSGYTTTGATILTDIETLPYGLRVSGSATGRNPKF